MDFIDEKNVARLEICKERGKIASLGDHRAGGGAEIDAELARDDLRQSGFSQARRPDEQHMIERFLTSARGLDEHREVGARLFLTDEFSKPLRPQARIDVVVAFFRGNQPARRGAHFASSFSPSLMSCAVSALSPASRAAAAMAAAACGWP